MGSDDQLRQFRTVGYVRLRDAVPTDVVSTMRASTWQALGDRGVAESDPSTWTATDDAWVAVDPNQHGAGGPGPEDSPSVRAILDALLGANRSPTRHWGKTLVALPQPGVTWTVPGSGWHFDHLYPSPGHVTAVNLFLLIDDVAAHGGGTAVVRNSPQLLDHLLNAGTRYSKVSEQNQSFLTATEWTRGLTAKRNARTAERTSRYLTDTIVEGIPLRIEELCGSAGDVFVCHPALFHTISMNVSHSPRLMRVQRIHAVGL